MITPLHSLDIDQNTSQLSNKDTDGGEGVINVGEDAGLTGSTSGGWCVWARLRAERASQCWTCPEYSPREGMAQACGRLGGGVLEPERRGICLVGSIKGVVSRS